MKIQREWKSEIGQLSLPSLFESFYFEAILLNHAHVVSNRQSHYQFATFAFTLWSALIGND